ncbi:MAG: hypothetical protein J5968_04460 [Oscillospiraceae bacterium]|nr:hypothetical protein [Oscillospiraceae bacterium]MBP1577561.1 hypothetical protein [Oscillospiraceae bacterium]
MNSIEFSALLESRPNGICEEGQAYIEHDNSVTFTSDFVPLIKLDSRATIIRVLGDKQFERFTGRVYLSSRNLLKLVDVDHELIDQALQLFDSNVIYPAEFYIAPGSSTRFNVQRAQSISGFLRYISEDTVRICTMEYVEPGQHLMFTINESGLAVEKMLVKITDRMLLMRSAAVLQCQPVSLSANNRTAIKNCLRLKEIQQQYDDITP